MKLLLALVLLLNSFMAVAGSVESCKSFALQLKSGRAPASAPQCDTPGELMSANVNTRDFTRICRNIVAQDAGCKKLKPEKRMSCNAKRENQILSSADLLSKAGQCAKGFLWDSMVDLGKFILDLIKMLVGAQINSVTAMIRFLSDSEYRQRALSSAQSGSRMGMAFLNSAGLYFSREFSRNLAKNPLNPLAAVGETLLTPLLKFVTESVQAIAQHYIPQYQCMNGTAKLYTICRVLGDFIMPPVFIFTFLKTGIRGLQALKGGANALKISRAQRRFAEANELSDVARAASRADAPRPSRITVDNSPRSPAMDRSRAARAAREARPAPPVVHGARPQPARPLAKPIEEHNADELIEIARAERNATADLNRAEAARIEAENARLAEEAAKAVDEAPSPAASAVVEATDENLQAIMVGYKTDAEYGKLFSGTKPYPEYHDELTYVINHLEKTNPGMTKAQIRETVERNLNSCSL